MKRILVKCMVFALAMALFTGSIGVIPTLAEETDPILLSENFDTVPVTSENKSIFGWNGWIAKATVSGKTLDDSNYTVADDPNVAGNKVASLNRPLGLPNDTKNSFMSKDLSRPMNFGLMSVRFKVRAENAASKYFQFRIYSPISTTNLQFQVDFTKSLIADTKTGGKYFLFGGATVNQPALLQHWYEFEVLINLFDNTVTYNEGGVQRGTAALHTDFKGATAKEILIGTNRLVEAGGQFYVDDFIVEDITDYDQIINDVNTEFTKTFSKILTSAVTLPTSLYGSQISWSSDNEGVVSSQGVVTRPDGEEFAYANLTANIALGNETVVKTYRAVVLPNGKNGESLRLMENFDALGSQESQSLFGWNGWNTWMQYPTKADLDEDYTIKTESDIAENKVASFHRYLGLADTTKNRFISKDVGEVLTTGLVSVGFRVRAENLAATYFQVRLYDVVNGVDASNWQFQVSFNYSSLAENSKTVAYFSDTQTSKLAELHKWYEVEILFDLDNRLITYFEGGRQLSNPLPMPDTFNGRIKEVRVGTNRIVEADGLFYFDDLVVKTLNNDAALGYAASMLAAFDQPVYQNIVLPANRYGADITWESSNPAIIANDGTVTRAEENTQVNLTATITRAGVSTTKTLPVTVLSKYDMKVNNISIVDGKITSVSLEKFVAPSDMSKVLISVYNTGKLDTVAMYELDPSVGLETILTDLSVGAEQSVKVFVWNMSTVKPLSAVYPQQTN